MFGFHQAAAQLNPAYIVGVGCRVCTCSGTCWDTCFGTCGYYSCGWSVGCGDSRIYEQFGQVGDPVEQLAQLRARLESALAGVDAQEKALRERGAGGAKGS